MLTDAEISELSVLTIRSLSDELRNHGVHLSGRQLRTKTHILNFLRTQPEHILQALRNRLAMDIGKASSTQSRGTKRSQEEVNLDINTAPVKQPHLCSSVIGTRSDTHGAFPHIPTHDQIKHCHLKFLNATSNHALRMAVCVSCACKRNSSDGKAYALDAVPNQSQLIPKTPHFAHKLTFGMLLVAEHIWTEGQNTMGWFCNDCLRALALNRLPALALANRMWIGPIPDPIAQLTVPEQMLIALYHPRCHIFKLYPRNTWGHNLGEDMLQHGLRGNVTTFEHNLPDVVRMLEGQLMPRPTSILASTITVTYIGPGRIPENWLKKTFRVRRSVVYAALHCFKYVTQHPGYQDINISNEVLDTLPLDNVPIEILATMSYEPDLECVQRESESYASNEGSSKLHYQIILTTESRFNIYFSFRGYGSNSRHGWRYVHRQ
jgi:hypothetical protein